MKIVQETLTRKPAESMICRVFDLPAFDCPYHQHNEIEILLIANSAGRVLVGDYVGQFRPGHIYIFGSQLPHAFINAPGGGPAKSLCIQFDPGLFARLADGIPEFKRLGAIPERCRRGWLLQGSLSKTAAACIARIFASHGPACVQELLRLCVALTCGAGRRELASEGYVPQRPGPRARRLEKALAIIHENSTTDLRIPELARRAGLSESALHRLFRQRMGCTPGAHLREVRLAGAARSLIESDDPISHIAFAAGFNNLSNFNRQFRSKFGRTPRYYRTAMAAGSSPRQNDSGISPTARTLRRAPGMRS